MTSLLSERYQHKQPHIFQQTGKTTRREVERIDQLILIVPYRQDDALWHRIPQGAKIKALMKRRPARSVPAVITRLSNQRQTRVILAALPKDADAFEQLTFARKLVAAACDEKTGNAWDLGRGFCRSRAGRYCCNGNHCRARRCIRDAGVQEQADAITHPLNSSSEFAGENRFESHRRGSGRQ